MLSLSPKGIGKVREYSEKPFFRQPSPRCPHKTSIHPPDYVHGEYEHEEGDIGDIDAVPIEITYVHSKDNRPDLKQFVTSLIMSIELPLFIQTLSGNASDNGHFRDIASKSHIPR